MSTGEGGLTHGTSRIVLAPGGSTPLSASVDDALVMVRLLVVDGAVDVTLVGSDGSAVVTPAPGTDLTIGPIVCGGGEPCPLDPARVPTVSLSTGASLTLSGIRFALASPSGAIVEAEAEFPLEAGFVFPKPKPR